MSNTIKILVIGGRGYIGSKLCQELSEQYDTESVDLELFSSYSCKVINHRQDYNNLSSEFYKKYTHIILLAGHSSVRMCDGVPSSVIKNNVQNFISLIDKLTNNQVLIYASSASVYGDCKEPIAFENYKLSEPHNMYDYSKQIIDTYCSIGNLNIKYIGLRFGTVNGYSPVLRDDVMLNAMVSSAWKTNKVMLYNGKTKRSILGINDLIRAIKLLLHTDKFNKIYNLSSFTNTAEYFANLVSKKTNSDLQIAQSNEKLNLNEKLLTNKYNFSMSCDKFINDYNFYFLDTPETIIDELINFKDTMIYTNRNAPYVY